MLFDDTDRARIAGAIAEAEGRTSGEIVVIVSAAPHRYPATSLFVAAFVALVLPLAAVWAGWRPADLFASWEALDATTRTLRAIEAFVAAQALLFVIALAVTHFAGLDRVLTPHGLRRDRVHRAAVVQFKARGLDATAGRTGVLIYVDEPERIAEVVTDKGVFTRVEADHWHDTVRALIDGIRAGRAADGMVAAIALAGEVLSRELPRAADDRNELPDHLIEI